MENKPCNQGQLPLTFSFYQPGTVCAIRLSIHSIVDSEGVEYKYHSEDCTYIVKIIDKNQHEGVKLRDRGVRTKEPSSLRFIGPLATKQYFKLAWQFKELYLCGKLKQIKQLSTQKLFQNGISDDIKVFSLC